MAKYRIGISENLLGDKRYQCQIKRFGIWWNDESFSTKERMLDYARKLEKAGHKEKLLWHNRYNRVSQKMVTTGKDKISFWKFPANTLKKSLFQ